MPSSSTVPGGVAAPLARPLATRSLTGHAERVDVPLYDRGRLTPAVVHLGLGGFHRAHQAVYFDELARRGNTDWGVVGVSLRRPDVKNALEPQDCLFTVVERDAEGDSARVVGSVIRSLCTLHESECALDALSDPRTRLVTLTITADGYDVDRVTGEWRPDPERLAEELADPTHPSSAYGFIVEGLARRRALGLPAFTVLSCDNLPDNGAAARTAVLSFARRRDESLARWIEERATFPSSMVDRITPSTSPADREWVAARFGVADRWPVMTETFSQWIVEDSFANGRPPLEAAGAQFVSDVAPYKLVKNRLLNGSHSALGCLGVLAGHRTTGHLMADPVFARYVDELMTDEIAPLLGELPGLDLDAYRETLLERLANPKIGDALSRLCARGSTKLPGYLLPSLAEALETGGRNRLLVLAVAGWMRHLRGHDRQGRRWAVTDPLKDTLQPLARDLGTDPAPLLAQRAVFGDLGSDDGLHQALSEALEDLDRHGARATVAAYTRSGTRELAA